MKKQVRYLQVGDILSSGAKVLTTPLSGIYTPKGKVEITIEYPSGKTRIQFWGKSTTVTTK